MGNAKGRQGMALDDALLGMVSYGLIRLLLADHSVDPEWVER